ncbi:DMT family transporter [Salidesulfovibrio onnuriiensis]|uniref:DMT family transporter n=1 Tax=Salidesulfovibrio onnuriiensis TaxID=2583823 RepID=UPI00164F6086|nr:DMT family transporter [Salidesulfovibrio onnuriiensis]
MQWNAFRKTQAAGYVFISLGILSWSGNFVAARGLAASVDPATLNLLRWVLASLLFLPFGFAAFWRERKAIGLLWKEIFVLALTGISLYDTMVFLAGRTSEALNMSLISTLSPLLTALMAQFFFKEKLRPSMYMGIAISTFGIVALVTDGNLERLLTLRFAEGDLLILGTALMSAVYNNIVSRISGKVGQTALVMALCLFGAVQIIPLYLWETGGQLVLPEFSSSLVWSLGYLAVFASILCFLFWNEAVQILGAPKAMLFYYTLPPASGLIAWLVIDEPAQLIQILSGMIIVAGILFALYGGAPKWRRRKVEVYGQPAEINK